MLFWDIESTAYGYGSSVSAGMEGNDLFLGGGVEYTASDKLGFRAEYEMYTLRGEVDGLGLYTDINLLSLNILYRF